MSDERLLEMRPGGLEILSTGLNLAELDLHGGDGFWEEVRRYARNSQLERQIDAAMSGRSAPRVWAFLESPGAGPAAAAAALGAAAILADRGQSVVVVDADEQEPRVTRWLGRSEREGWIDMIRFGASLHAASDPLPSEGRRGAIVGVGSFAPTGVTPDEVAELLSRLRRQADDLVLILPVKLRSLPWLEVAHIRLLCWDLLSRSTLDTEKILVEMDRMGARPDALLGFGAEEFAAIQNRLREEIAADEPVAPAAEQVRADEPAPAAAAEMPEPVAAAADRSQAVVEAAWDGPQPSDATGAELAASLPGEHETAPARPRRRSSGIFLFVAIAAVACVVLLGLWLGGQLTGDRGAVPRGPAVARLDPQGGSLPAAVDGGEAPGGSPAAMPAQPDSDVVTGGESPAADSPAVAVAVDPATAAGTTSGTADETPAGTATTGETNAAAEPPAATTPPGERGAAMDWSPYRRPAGQDGWALWLYSFPDEAGARTEVNQLERRGIRAAFRAVEIKDRGRWYRVYVGSFPDRAAAAAAAAALKNALAHAWAEPARF